MKKWNIESFGSKSDFKSSWAWVYDEFMALPNSVLYGLYVGGDLVSVTMMAESDRVFEVVMWGRKPGINNLGKLVLKHEVELCSETGKRYISYMPTYSRWKVEFKLDTAPLYRFKKGKISDVVEQTNCEIPMQERMKLRERGLL